MRQAFASAKRPYNAGKNVLLGGVSNRPAKVLSTSLAQSDSVW
jgi:hypothetical protein